VQAIAVQKSNTACAVHNAVRSCCLALRQERALFRDPSQGLTMSGAEILPRSVTSDLLIGPPWSRSIRLLGFGRTGDRRGIARSLDP
jgi:hypothetical protein